MQNTRSLQQPSIAGRNRRRKDKEDKVEPLFQRSDLHFSGPKKCKSHVLCNNRALLGGTGEGRKGRQGRTPCFKERAICTFRGPKSAKHTFFATTVHCWEEQEKEGEGRQGRTPVSKNVRFALSGAEQVQKNTRSLQQPSNAGRNRRRKEKANQVQPLFQSCQGIGKNLVEV